MSAQIEIPAGEAAGQNEPRWVRLRNLIDTYPKDSGILKELIQNADDGEARTVRIVLDQRQNLNHPLANHDTFQHLIGPAILAFNDQPFRDQDFINLQNLANSSKIEDAFKTGRFGLGFNSVYNITDFPILLTGEKLWCLDPCETLLRKPAGGERWGLKQIVRTQFESITSLFESVGYKTGAQSFDGTAIRLPLRTDKHIQFNQDPGQLNGKARISSIPFQTEDFQKLVKGLSEIAHEILLFLKNVEVISCECIDAKGKSEVLLKIELINSTQVREARGIINQVLKQGLEGALTAASSANHGILESSFEASVLVTHATGQIEQSDWLVSAGLFAGRNNSLVKLSRELKQHGERGLPHAAVAICLARGVQRFPKLAGRVFCYLPIASNEYTGKLPIHIHGAFSLENSRTSLTTHRSDEHGKQKLLAQWNDCLLKEGVARAYASALSRITKLSSIDLKSEERAANIYSLFPASPNRLTAHHSTLAKQVVRELALCPIFLDVHGKWQPASELVQFDQDAELETCLASEGFVFAAPRVPIHVQNLLSEVGQPLIRLNSEHIREHFEVAEEFECKLGDHTFTGLRTRASIIAVARFLIQQQEQDWTSLPLGLTADGCVRALSSDDPIVLGTPRQRSILSICPRNLASAELNALWDQERRPVPEGLSLAIPVVWLPMLATHFHARGENGAKLCPKGRNLPTTAWLKDVLDELNAIPEHAEPRDSLIDAVPLVPDDSGRLHLPGLASTPLLLQLNEQSARSFLDALGVSYRVLRPNNSLTNPLAEFERKYQRVWTLHPADLIDSIHHSLDDLEKEPRAWATREVVDPLLAALERHWDENLASDTDRLAKLRVLPIFEDSAGNFGAIDETCFSTGEGFDPPDFMGELRLIRGLTCPRILKSLGVKVFSRRALLEQCLLPYYEDQSSEVRCDWLHWIRDEWNRLIGEFAGGQDELVALLEDEELIQTETGLLRSANVCYDPSDRGSMEAVLGDVAAFPDLRCYQRDQRLWMDLFHRLGLRQKPSAQHLADRVLGLMGNVDAHGLEPECRLSIIATARYIYDNWHAIAHEPVQLPRETGRSLGEFLRAAAWLPAASGADLQQYLGAVEPDPRLYEAAELSPYAMGHIVSSVRPLLPRELHASKDFGISFTPPWEDVAEHFENLLDVAGDTELSDEDLNRLKKPVTEIYRYFGQQGSQIGPEDQPGDQFNRIAERFADCPCILVPEEHRFFRPEDVYRSGGRGLHPLKLVLSTPDSFVEKGLEMLGRRHEPSVEDLSNALTRLADQQPEALSPELRNAVTRCLEIIGEKVEDPSEADQGLPEILVLNQNGYLVPPTAVIMLDSTTPRDALEISKDAMLDEQTPQRVVHLWAIRHSRDAKVTPASFKESLNSAFARECQKLQQRLKEPAFLAGLARVLYDHHGVATSELAWLADLIVKPCASLTCNHELTMENGIRSLGIWPEDCCLHSMETGKQILLDESTFEDEVLFEKFADRLAKLVSDGCLANLAPLVKILCCSPASIDRILTKLGIRALPNPLPFEQELATDAPSDFFTMDEADAEDSLGDARPLSSERWTDAEAQDNDDTEEIEDEETIDEQSTGPESEETYGSLLDAGLPDDEAATFGDPSQADGGSSLGTQAARAYRNGLERRSRHPTRNGTDRPSSTTDTTGRTHLRMLPGRGDDSTPQAQGPSPAQRQQDGLWISRPAPPKSPSPAVPPPADTHNDEELINHSVGKAAVGLVLMYERSQGRRAQNMAHANPGYDVESRHGRVVERYIEVKGLDGAWGINGVPLSPIQLQLAKEKGDSYWLYVVENARDPDRARIHMIQNPAGRISQFRFDHGWRLAGTTIQTSILPRPETGRRIQVFDPDGSHKVGEIVTIDPSENQLYLRVRYESTEPAKTELYDPIYMQVL